MQHRLRESAGVAIGQSSVLLILSLRPMYVWLNNGTLESTGFAGMILWSQRHFFQFFHVVALKNQRAAP
jgi:hypothetical protein